MSWVQTGNIKGPPGVDGSEGERGLQGEVGPQGAEGIQGAQGETGPAGQSTRILGPLVNHTPDQLPDDGFIPADWDQTGRPRNNLQFQINDAVIYTPVDEDDPLFGHVYQYMPNEGGWMDIGRIIGPQGDIGPQGPTGPTGPQGEKGDIGVQGPAGATGAASTIPGPQGSAGPQGATGPGVVTGGTTGQILSKKSNTDFDTQWGPETIWMVVRKESDEQVASSNVVQDDNHLQFQTAVGVPYEIEMLVLYSNPGGTKGDIKCELSEDATARGSTIWIGLSTSDAAQALTTTDVGGVSATFGTAVAKRVARGLAHHVGGGGLFKFRWAQNTSDAQPTIVYAGSVLRYRQIT